MGALTLRCGPNRFRSKESGDAQAERGHCELMESVDTTNVIPNEKAAGGGGGRGILRVVPCRDDILGKGVQGFRTIITIPGISNRDFAT